MGAVPVTMRASTEYSECVEASISLASCRMWVVCDPRGTRSRYMSRDGASSGRCPVRS